MEVRVFVVATLICGVVMFAGCSESSQINDSGGSHTAQPVGQDPRVPAAPKGVSHRQSGPISRSATHIQIGQVGVEADRLRGSVAEFAEGIRNARAPERMTPAERRGG